jgi:hypothetical protein
MDSLSEGEARPVLTRKFETESRSGMEAARCILVTDGTDWQFPDELKRKLKR